MRKKLNLTVATAINGKGGISTVLQVLQDEGFFTVTNSKLIASHSSCNRIKLLGIFIFSLASLIYYLSFFKVGIVHVHMASRGSYRRKSIIIRLTRFFDAKVILHLHGAEFSHFYNDECSFQKQKHIQKTFSLATRVIVLSTQWKEWVDKTLLSEKKSIIVYNAVPELKLPKSSENKKTILFLGRLGKRKGVDDLLEAFALISIANPDCELHLGGDGDKAYYQNKIDSLKLKKQVKLLGWVSGDTKAQCLSNATIYCLPSYNEGFPMGVLEAMSAGVPVIASRAGGIPDAITHEKEGLLIDAGDTEALASQLESLLANESLRKTYAAAAKKKYINRFSPQAIIPQLLDIYEELSNP